MFPPIIIAHRGDSSRAPENSREAVRLALSLPVDMIELDVRKSRDNQLYVIHDQETGRTADRNIDIEQAEAEEIAEVKLRNGEPVPTLREILDLVAGKAGLNLEIKSDGAGGLCAAQLAGYGYRGRVLISSFKEREVLDARRVMPSLAFSEIFDDFATKDLGRYAAKSYGVVSLRKKTVTKGLVDACHERGVRVYVWTVDEEEDMRKFIDWGVDGIYSNKPAVLKEMVKSAKLQVQSKK
ncbi:MAG TPA: glycerophosphodiester phosphodiesterase [Nitrospirota bacterium]|nr:glycerophosphodiester phosphodiesterase [Nitrospirota bacterium]